MVLAGTSKKRKYWRGTYFAFEMGLMNKGLGKNYPGGSNFTSERAEAAGANDDSLCRASHRNPSATERTWAVAKTHPHREQLALEHLARQGFETYCPRVRARIRRTGRYQDVVQPLFPSYVFIRIHPLRAQWRPILSTIGVRTLVRFGDMPSLLEDGFIQGLRAREENRVIVRSSPIVQPAKPYQAGQKVQINGGPFDRAVATVLNVEEKDRLIVLLNLLQYGVRAKIAADQVVPA